MPQNKNPDMAELIRGKKGRVHGNLFSLLTVMKALPLAYNKDLQEDKEGMFDTAETITVALDILAGMLSTMTVNKGKMISAAQKDFSNTTELADYLVSKGIPFRKAHEIGGKLVLEASKGEYYLLNIALVDYQKISEVIEEDIYDKLSSKQAIAGRTSLGGTAFSQVTEQIKKALAELEN